MSYAEALQAKHRHCHKLLKLKNVVAVYVGKKKTGGQSTDEDCVKVGVKQKVTRDMLLPSQVIPATVRPKWYSTKTIKTDVEQVGTIVARQVRQGRMRPAPAGVSVGHFNITAGTLGLWMTKDGNVVMLSNNHVLADTNAADPGNTILQPGPVDGGVPGTDDLATLLDYVPITFEGIPIPDECPFAARVVEVLNLCCKAISSKTRYAVFDEATPNLVDAAIALPNNEADVWPAVMGPPGQNPIKVKGIRPLRMGDEVTKSGRTTGWTQGMVTGINGTVSVQYGVGQIALFEDQVLIEPGQFSAGGDSGSAILTQDGFLGGLLFAGSEEMTIANQIEHVMSGLGITGVA